MDTNVILPIVLAHAAAAVVLWLWQSYLIVRVLPRTQTNRPLEADKHLILEQLRPAEFAYLVRRGEIGHSLSVLAVDIVQRWAKSLKSDETAVPISSLAKYESNMLGMIVRQVKDWTQEKKEMILLEGLKRDPVGYARRMSKLYKFFTQTFRSFIVQISKDPRHLRRYFSVAGLLRLVSDFSSAGYRDAFEQELKEDLLNRGLIVTEERRDVFAQIAIYNGALAIVASSVVFFLLMGLHPTTIVLFLACAIGTCISRFIYMLREFVPYYSEFIEVLPLIERRSWRVSVLRIVARFLHLLLLGFCTCIFLAPLLIAVLCLRLANITVMPEQLIYVICTAIVLMPALDFMITGVRLFNQQVPSSLGLSLIKDTRQKVGQLRPLDSFKEMLQNPDYDPTFTEVMAIYGLETLFFLA